MYFYIMSLFLGEFKPSLTEGNRLALPKKIRQPLSGDQVVLSRGFETCVFGYRKSSWQAEANKQAEQPISSPQVRDLKRYMFSGAAEVSIDGQGRIVVPANLVEYAKLFGQVVVIGAGDHFEIWDKDLWLKHLNTISTQVGQ